MTIRLATIRDIEIFAAAYFDFLCEKDLVWSGVPSSVLARAIDSFTEGAFRQALSGVKGCAAVAEVDGQVVSSVVLIYDDNHSIGRAAVCFLIHTHRDFRKRGYAKKLLAWAEKRAFLEGCKVLETAVLDTNTSSKALMLGAGYQPFGILVRKPLDLNAGE